jgi:mono/diheme cytochrome c family protein
MGRTSLALMLAAASASFWQAPAATSASIARGKYLVEDIAVCWTCHTTRDERGDPDRTRWLLGAPVFYRPAMPIPGWADVAPRLAGLPPGTDDQFITLMMTGISRTGAAPRPPMPHFAMTRSDAEAVLAYLKSLTSTVSSKWKDTYATLHMWMQIVGKVALVLAPPLNHSWAVSFHLTPRGLTTQVLQHVDRSFTMEFDFIDHRLVVRASNGDVRTIALAPKSVADFYREVMQLLQDMSLAVKIWTMPAEVPSPIRFEEDIEHHSYEPDLANRFWRILAAIEPVFTASRARFVGKSSPAHFFWGGPDLAVTRFSGRPAPPREGPAFMREAYSHEVISHGFWPGAAQLPEPVFYGYAVPEPAGLKEAQVRPDGTYYHRELGEFILPYEAVRTAPSPEHAIADFIDSTYEAASSLAHWDRAALERQ